MTAGVITKVIGIAVLVLPLACGAGAGASDAAAGAGGGSRGGAARTSGGAGGTSGGGGAAGTSGRAGQGGNAGGGGGSGGSAAYACYQQGGMCLGDCTSPCPSGWRSASSSCPITESNAVCGGHCCLPMVPSDGGTGDAPALTYSCGSQTCSGGQTFCYSYTPGTPGGTSSACTTLPPTCAGNPTCSCVCPPSSSPPFGCNYAGNNVGGACSCTETNGMLTVMCLGV